MTCNHGHIVAARVLLRSESPRDLLDILRVALSLPRAFQYDWAEGAARADLAVARGGGSDPVFNPPLGRLFDPLDKDTARALEAGDKVLVIPGLEPDPLPPGAVWALAPEDGRPAVYCIQDRFHACQAAAAPYHLSTHVATRHPSSLKALCEAKNSQFGEYRVSLNSMSAWTHVFFVYRLVVLDNVRRIDEHMRKVEARRSGYKGAQTRCVLGHCNPSADDFHDRNWCILRGLVECHNLERLV